MKEFFGNLVAGIGTSDVLDILIVTFVIYKVIGFIRETRAQQLVKGLVFLILAFFLSNALHLYTIYWILKETMTLGVIALVVVFQPELRRGLEYMGRSKLVKAPFGQLDKDMAKEMSSEIAKAIDEFSATKTGALIILERETALADVVETGTVLNADISKEILGNVFYEGAPLHDGAVIIRSDKVYAAGCVLPLTGNKELNKALGTRHRAGIGITENSDAIAIIVSEETGVISMAIDGNLTRFLDKKVIEKKLLNIYFPSNEENDMRTRIKKTIRRKKDVK